MKSKKRERSAEKSGGSFEHLAADTDFYGSAPSERPLYNDQRNRDANMGLNTGRHKTKGRPEEAIDHRDRMAFLAILKTIALILILIIALFVLRKGVSIYEQTRLDERRLANVGSNTLREMVELQEFDIESQDAREMFAERIEVWKEADRLTRSADVLVKRGNIQLSIERCLDALELDPAHLGALERLGELYFQTEQHNAAINAYIRMLSVDPSRSDLQERLIRSLDAYGDAKAVVFMALWYQDQNNYNENVQRYLARALLNLEEFEEAVVAYERVLIDVPKDPAALSRLADAYMSLERYGDALNVLDRLHEQSYRDQNYYYRVMICHARLGHALETVQTLGKAAHLFGQGVALEWIRDPMLDPVREDPGFQAFADRVGGEDFRVYLEKVARAVEGDDEKNDEITPQLELPSEDSMELEARPKSP